MSLPSFSPVDHSSPNRQKLRIAVLNRTFSSTGGGAERYSIAMVEQLSARHEMHVFAQEIDHQWPGVTYHRISAPLRNPRWVNQLWFATASWWATRRGFDVVHSHEMTWHGDVQTVHVLPVRYNVFHGRSGWRRTLRWLKVMVSPSLLTYLSLERLRFALRPGRQVIVTAESLRTIMALSYPACRGALFVITPGITMPQLAVTPRRKHEARVRLGLPVTGSYLLFVGNDYRKKGLETLLDALVQLPAGVALAVVGNPVHIPAFRKRVQAMDIGSRVFFLGSLRDTGPAYAAADCLVHPTLEDTFGMVVLEAMAHGLPVVVSGPRYCGISGLLQHGVKAMILHDPRDAAGLIKLLVQVLGQQALQDRLGQAATEFAAQYQWETIALQQEAVYFSVLAAKKTGHPR